jgi:VanZ family protein
MLISKKEFHWLVAPSQSVLWAIIPVSYTLVIQALTGFPKPQTMKEISAHDFLIYISEELFDYPYWLQDLSHFPLFFLLAWLWAWFLRRKDPKYSALFKSLLICTSFAVLNELSQFFIPRRFPSIADVVMNLAGVGASIIIHSYFFTKLRSRLKLYKC